MERIPILNGKSILDDCVECAAYPNPTRDRLELRIEGLNGTELRFKLFNLDGKVLQSNSISSQVTNLSIGNCENGPYFLKVTNGETQSRLFKIVKCH